MKKIKITEGFRFGGVFYGASGKQVEVSGAVADYGLSRGLARPVAKKAAKTKNKGDAPSNKSK